MPSIGRRAWWAMAGSCVVLMVAAGVSLLDRPDGFAYLTALSMSGFLIAAVVAGVIIRNRERIFVDTERRAAAAEADRAGRSRAGGAQRAQPDRPRDARRGGPQHERRSPCRPPPDARSCTSIPTRRPRCSPADRERSDVSRSPNCDACSACCARPATTRPSLAPQPGIVDIAAAVDAVDRSGRADGAGGRGRAARASRPGIELAALPDRAGGADQRSQARRRLGLGDRAHRLRAARARDRGHRRRAWRGHLAGRRSAAATV